MERRLEKLAKEYQGKKGKGKGGEFIRQTKLVRQEQESVKGFDIKYSIVEIDAESHGVTLPRIIKHIQCSPPAPVKFVQEVALFKESLGLMDEPVLSQFVRDSVNFG